MHKATILLAAAALVCVGANPPPLAPPCCPEFKPPQCCPLVCPDTFEPVCATDCDTFTTFHNLCVMDKHNCEYNKRWRVSSEGKCHKRYPIIYWEKPEVEILEPPTVIKKPIYWETPEVEVLEPPTVIKKPIYWEKPEVEILEPPTVIKKPIYWEKPEVEILEPPTVIKKPIYWEKPEVEILEPPTVIKKPVYEEEVVEVKKLWPHRSEIFQIEDPHIRIPY